MGGVRNSNVKLLCLYLWMSVLAYEPVFVLLSVNEKLCLFVFLHTCMSFKSLSLSLCFVYMCMDSYIILDNFVFLIILSTCRSECKSYAIHMRWMDCDKFVDTWNKKKIPSIKKNVKQVCQVYRCHHITLTNMWCAHEWERTE